MKSYNENLKKLLRAGLVGILSLFLLVGVGLNYNAKVKKEAGMEEKDKTEYQYHVAIISDTPTDSFWKKICEGAKKAGKDDKILIENFGETLSGEYSAKELMEMAIAAKVDGIIVQVSNEEEMTGLIDKASDLGIPVMTIRSDAPSSKRVSFVSGNDYAIGEMYGNQISNIAQMKAEEEDRKIRVTVLLNSEEKNASPNVIFAAISEATASISDKIELTSKKIDNTGMFESEENVRDLILDPAYPDIIVCMSAVDTSSAIQCVVDYNKVGQTSIIGYYAQKDTLEGIKKGIVESSVVTNPAEWGRQAEQGMQEYFATQHVSEYLTVSPELITEDNVKDYAEQE